jgi:hypothetical protein
MQKSQLEEPNPDCHSNRKLRNKNTKILSSKIQSSAVLDIRCYGLYCLLQGQEQNFANITDQI